MTGENEGSVHFKALNDSEKRSKISQACNNNEIKVTIWKKGDSSKSFVRFNNFFHEQKEILISEGNVSHLVGNDVLYSFDLNGLKFFGKGKMTSQTGQNFYLNYAGDMYKSERRVNFRLLTFPHQEVYIHFPIEGTQDSGGGLVNLKTGISETKIFENFLELVQGETEEDSDLSNHLKIRVIDISVTGAALLLSEHELEILNKFDNSFEKIILDFNGTFVELPGCTILYSNDYELQSKKASYKKAGIKFENLDINLDEELSAIINKTLRSLESEFEDFLR